MSDRRKNYNDSIKRNFVRYVYVTQLVVELGSHKSADLWTLTNLLILTGKVDG